MFLFITSLLLLHNVYSQPCPNSCSGNGRCVSTSRVCECNSGFFGGDCSLRNCPVGRAWSDIATGVDIAHNLAECSNMGICDRSTGVCTCASGFSGDACERKDCPYSCNNYGKCESMEKYASTKDPGSGTVFPYTIPWDHDKIWGCNCDVGYYGPSCASRYCPTGDDPLTGVGVGTLTNPTQFNEIQLVQCKAGGGTFTLTFQGKTTQKIAFNAKSTNIQAAIEALPNVGAGNTKIVMFGSQACLSSGTSWTVEFLQNFGDLPLMVPDKRLLTFSDALNVPSLNVVEQTKGTKENAACANRGICDPTVGWCTCSTNFDTSNGYNAPGVRGDCGRATQSIQQCPGATSCSAHGQCTGNPTYRCLCSAGWTGADCSDRTCPTSVSWFALPSSSETAHIFENNECADMGVCDRVTGSCICESGFTGAACNRMVCPGSPDECSGHGQCLDMMTLATHSNINGDAAGFTYGLVPNNPLTWDANMVRGCYCDPGYTGYDCSLKSCVKGDDPLTVGQVDEKQTINCISTAGGGSLVFKFRQAVGPTISAISSLSQLQAYLQAIPTVGQVMVELVNSNDPDKICPSVAGSGIVVTFLTTHGDLPLLTASKQGVDSIIISETTKGTKENIECNGRGVCINELGTCSCFEGFGSSDGMGGSGISGDCGYVEPVINVLQL